MGLHLFFYFSTALIYHNKYDSGITSSKCLGFLLVGRVNRGVVLSVGVKKSTSTPMLGGVLYHSVIEK